MQLSINEKVKIKLSYNLNMKHVKNPFKKPKKVSYNDTMGIKLRVEEEQTKELMSKDKRDIVVRNDITQAMKIAQKKSITKLVPRINPKLRWALLITFMVAVIIAIVLVTIYLA